MTDPAFDSGGGEGSRDYVDVGEAARELGGQAPLPGGQEPPRGGEQPGGEEPIRPVEESEDVAAAVEDEAPVPELAPEPEEPGGGGARP
ncbi:MAG: hypothetical protein IRZ05_12325 [Micromonosporaceae bacterium]|nr:hypothetical protein [Micromonosporaceae bacterium]